MLQRVCPVCCLQLSGTLFWPDPNPTETLCVCACPRILLLIVLPDRLRCGVNLQVTGVASRVCPVTCSKGPKRDKEINEIMRIHLFLFVQLNAEFCYRDFINSIYLLFMMLFLHNLSSPICLPLLLKFATCTKIILSHFSFHLLTF